MDTLSRNALPQKTNKERTPLSFAQQGLWLTDQLEPGNAFNNIALEINLRKLLDTRLLERCLNEIVARHDVLRTNFMQHGDEVVQSIAPSLTLALPIVDLAGYPPALREQELRRRVAEKSGAGFDLQREPLLRTTLFRLSGQEHVLLLVVHHIVFDGWSMGVFNRELEALYSAYGKEQPSPLSCLTIRYADYAIRQRQWLQGEELEKLLAYWRAKLADAPRLELPSDRPSPAQPDYRICRHELLLPPDLYAALKQLATRENCTLFMVMAAAFKLLLHRYSGQEDIVVGVPVAGRRNRDEQGGLIGFFVNTLVLRTDLSGDPAFCELLQRERGVALAAYRHSNLPFDKLVEELRPERETGLNPFVDVLINYMDEPWLTLKLDGLDTSRIKRAEQQSGFALSLEIIARSDGLSLILVYQSALFSAGKIHNLMNLHFQTLLEGIAANPQAKLSELPLLTDAERRQVLVEWNDTARDYPRDLCVHQLSEAQVARTPDAVALVQGDQQLSYAELDARANRLAHHLRGMGIAEEMRVAICVERSIEMVVGLLGVLKAGAAYVPLDPDYPKERLAFMLADSAVSVVLTQSRLVERLPQNGVQRVCLDAGWPEIMQQPDYPPVRTVTPHNLAYVIYTSGSTGTPKGVAIEHRSITDHCHAICEHYQLSASDRVFQFASFSFDVSVDQILSTLSAGAVVVLGRHKHMEPAELDADIRQHGVTVLGFPPATFQLWLRFYGANNPPPEKLRLVVLTGDVLARESVMAWRALPDSTARLVNAYGPTEATIWATLYTIPAIPGGGGIPIGRPLYNTHVYVLDRYLQPVPVGVVGELYIGGVRVARGYLNRPELTAERFIPDPFGNAGDRLYRTGDRVRYLPDGNIEFLGRLDHQVKLRGFRIELGEVEAVLRQFPAVRDAAALVREDRPGDPRLVAYVAALPDTTPSPAALREFLLLKLPGYMVPSAYVMLESLPLTPNGKLDRKALPAPDAESLASTHGFAAPTNSAEQTLCGIWADVLGVEQIGIHDNFFELGGHSLLGTQLISKINRVFCIRVPLLSLFDKPTIAAQSKEIEQLQLAAMMEEQDLEHLLCEVELLPADEHFPLSYAQQGLWLTDQIEPGNAAHNIAFETCFRGAMDTGLLERCLNEIVDRHDVLRTTFTQHGDEAVQTIGPSLALALPIVDLAGYPQTLREQELRRRVAEESDTRFDLQRGPLLRTTLFRLSGQEHVLLLVVHHIIFDGWSRGIFNRELEALYSAYGKGQPSPLPGLPTRYADYAVWQRQWLQGKELEKLLAYWRAKLADAPRLKLPSDRPNPARTDYRVSHHELHLSRDLSTALKQFATRENCTLFMVLAATFKLLLHRYSGQEDIVVGAPIAGHRNRDEYKRLLGFFVNTIVLRTDFSGDPTFRELLQREREVALGAYQHSGLPFDKLVEELRPERKAGLNPFVDVLINYINESWLTLKLDGLDTGKMRAVEQQSSFALSLGIVDTTDGIDLELRYQSAIFSAGQINSLLDQFRYLLEQISNTPQLHLSSYSLLTPAARSLLPDPAVLIPEPPVELVPDSFSAWLKQTPQQTAIRQGGQVWTYAMLSACSQAQARQMLALGVQPGDVVAVTGSRSFGLIGAMLAVFMSGGVLLALDKSLPLARQQLMLREAKAKFMIRAGDGADDSWSHGSLQRMDVDAKTGRALNPTYSHDNDGAPLPHSSPDDPAYIFFTSGSTGVPKGILGTHKGMAHMIAWQRETFFITPSDHCAQLIHLSFDVVLRDIFLPLTSGATLCLPDEEDEAEGTRILSWIARERITLLHTVPSLAQSWLENAPHETLLPELRWMFFSGEPLNGALVQQWQKKAPACGFINLYGPTETTLIKSFYRVPAEVLPVTQPLGKPLPGTQIMVLGNQGEMCGIGEPGEIVIRTPFGTLGYLNPPCDERKGFAKNPFRDDENDRVYYTGDRGYYGVDGLLYILGRLDHQVKINGVRIEPGEVTAILAQSAAVKSCVVLGRKDARGKDVLVAYVVPQHAGDVAGEARAYLAERLPFAMVPAACMLLEQLPLKPNGKIDLDKLPAWEGNSSVSRHNHVAPETSTEKLLTGIWKDVLRLETLGVHDDFFALGGHSLSGTQLISKVNRAFCIRMPLRSLFDKPTVLSQSKEIERLQHEAMKEEKNLEHLLREVELLQADDKMQLVK